MPYSGAFKARNSYQQPAPRRNWGTGVDPRHSDPMWGTDQGFPGPSNRRKLQVPAFVEDSFDPETAEPPYFRSKDTEPPGHEGIGPAPRNPSDMAVQEADNIGRSIDRGAMDDRDATMVMRDHTQTFSSERTYSMPPNDAENGTCPPEGQAKRALRGFNSLDENNPGNPEVNFSGNYTRQGAEINRWTNRRVPRRTLRHTKRDIHLNLATTAAVTHGPQGQDYSPYSSPYASVARLVAATAAPMQRREPRPWDENAVTDGSDIPTEYDQSQMNSWGL